MSGGVGMEYLFSRFKGFFLICTFTSAVWLQKIKRKIEYDSKFNITYSKIRIAIFTKIFEYFKD